MLRRSLSESAGHLWQPAELESAANPYKKNPKHLQNLRHFLLIKVFIPIYTVLPKNILLLYLFIFKIHHFHQGHNQVHIICYLWEIRKIIFYQLIEIAPTNKCMACLVTIWINVTCAYVNSMIKNWSNVECYTTLFYFNFY